MARSPRQVAADNKMRKRVVPAHAAELMTKERWQVFLQHVANGATRSAACASASVANLTVQAFVIAEPTAAKELRKAELAWIRRDWPIERIDEFLTLVATGSILKEAAIKMAFMEGELQQLMTVLLGDPAMRGLYDEARELQAETWADEMIEIADDTTGDTYIYTDRQGNEHLKTDNEVVNRSKLKIAARQWIISRLHKDRFGDRIQQDISGELNVNHADMLDSARRRKEDSRKRAEELTHKVIKDPPQPQVH